jgi:hypothetical protein
MAAYALDARYERSGADCLPVIRIGKPLRVPRARLELLAGGRLLAPAEAGRRARST